MRVMCLIVLLGAATACEGCELAAGELVVASRTSVGPLTLDGKIDSTEWKGACVVPLAAGFHWRVVMDEQSIRMAWTAPSALPFYVDVYVLDPQGDVLNLHASMKLGERRLSGDAWDDRSPPFVWGDPIGWRANVATVDTDVPSSAPFTERLHRRDGIELSLSRQRFDFPLVLRFELRDFAGAQADIAYPSASTRHEREGWLRLRVNGAPWPVEQPRGPARPVNPPHGGSGADGQHQQPPAASGPTAADGQPCRGSGPRTEHHQHHLSLLVLFGPEFMRHAGVDQYRLALAQDPLLAVEPR
jgi:hypothetical protein